MSKKTWLCVLTVAGTSMAASHVSAQALDGTLKKVQDRGAITLGIRESSFPLSYLDASQKPVGYHIDICMKIADAVKARLKLEDLKINHQAVTSQNRIPLTVNGTVDLECGSTTNNAGRQQQVAFAPTTYVTNVKVAVKKSSGITSLTQLGGKPVATTKGTTSVQLMRGYEKDKGVDFNEVFGRDHADSFLMLQTDRAAAFVMDDNLLLGLIASAENSADYAVVGESLSVEPISIMLRKNDPQFYGLVHATVKDMMKSGEIRKLYTKWFLSPIPPKGVNLNFPMSDTLKDAIAKPNDNPAESYVK